MLKKINVPDLGEAEGAKIEEILVSAGDPVKQGDTLVIFETSKVAVELPSPGNGKVSEIFVSVGDAVNEDQLIISIELLGDQGGESDSTSNSSLNELEDDISTQVLVLGSGPGGYSAAFRAADLGKNVVIVERNGTLGGVCLNVGCIPSKALLHAAKVVSETKEMAKLGIKFSSLDIDTEALRGWKNKVVGQLTGGLTSLAKKRNVQVVNGVGTFDSPNKLKVTFPSGRSVYIEFEQAVIAAGSEPVEIPAFPNDDSSHANFNRSIRS